jgi:hypothetical protein
VETVATCEARAVTTGDLAAEVRRGGVLRRLMIEFS